MDAEHVVKARPLDCVSCGKRFETRHGGKITCSGYCSYERKKRMVRLHYQNNKAQRREYVRDYRRKYGVS